MAVDRSKITHCRTCEKLLEKAPGETPKQFERRTREGYCRAKCKPKGPSRPAASNFGLEIPTRRSQNLTAGFRGYLEGYQQEFAGSFFKEVDQEDPKYRAWIRTQRCLVPGCHEPAQHHHQNKEGDGKMGGKCDDRRGLPFCVYHHNGGGTEALPGCYHGPAKITGRAFLALYRIDPEKQIKIHNMRYETEKKGGATGGNGGSGKEAIPQVSHGIHLERSV